MATNSSTTFSFLLLISALMISANADNHSAEFLTYTGFEHLTNFNLSGSTVIMELTKKEFPALAEQAVSMAVVRLPPRGVHAAHAHPDAGELMWVMQGTIKVGFVDNHNVTVESTIRAPDMFVFPKGVVHFEVNVNDTDIATAISMFGNAAPSTVVYDGKTSMIEKEKVSIKALVELKRPKCFLFICLPSSFLRIKDCRLPVLLFASVASAL